jgi:hypothetical protein
MRKVYLDVTIKVVANVDDSVSNVCDIIDRIDFDITGDGEFVDVEDSEVTNFMITDSK